LLILVNMPMPFPSLLSFDAEPHAVYNRLVI